MAYIFIDNAAWVCYTKNKRMVLSMEQCEVNGQYVYLQENLAEANHEFDIDRCNL